MRFAKGEKQLFVSECFKVNGKGNLTIGGCDTVSLAKEFGTPLYVIDEEQIRKNCNIYKNALNKYYDGKGLPIYASKALNCKEICRIIKDEGMGLDVVSEGELYTALKAGFPAERIHFHGNNKTLQELEMAINSGVGRIVVDNTDELSTINEICIKKGISINISIRIRPGVVAHTHKSITTGQIDSKFGFALQTGEAMDAVKKICGLSNVNLKQIHCHIGSQIFGVEPFEQAALVMLNFIKDIRDECGLEIDELNLGGGFGIRYTQEDDNIDYDKNIEHVANTIKSIVSQLKIKMPFIYMEPGRSIVGGAGLTLYTVGNIKHIPEVRTYVSVDGGMCDNPRYALYKSKYSAAVANKAEKMADTKVTIAGKCCESGDIIQEDTLIQKPEKGDILAVFSTGAYNYSMASNYNRIPKPAMVMTNNGQARLIVKRQSLDDLICNDI